MAEYALVDNELARRIELASIAELQAWVDDSRRRGIYPDAASFRVGGGLAIWFSPGNIVNCSFGLGMGRVVEKEEIAALVAFFAERATPARVDVCPHADPSLLRWLAEAGFVATDFETVLYQPLPATELRATAPGVEVRIASTPEAREVWADLEARGFTDDQPTEDHRILSTSIALRAQAIPFIGYLEGKPAGTGMLTISDGIAMFNGDSTLPAARNRGVQSALLAERLRYAAAVGCDLGVIEAAPTGGSQRNQLRAGFRIAYTRVTLELPEARQG